MSSAPLPAASTGDATLESGAWRRMLPLLPRNVVLVLLGMYRGTISHVYGDVCRYYPSCSAYAVGAVQQHGAAKGGVLAIARILRCHPWAAGGVDDPPSNSSFPYALTRRGFVVPPRKD
jgi:putative membrane protein insertion efficiency factor